MRGVGVRGWPTMVTVMATPPPTIDHGQRLLEIYDHAVEDEFTYLRARCVGGPWSPD